MEINVIPKIRSLLRRRQPFFCLSYDFYSREICVHATHADYFAEIVEHRDAGHVKRAELYAKQTIKVEGEEYLLHLVSYGDFRKGKIVMGENPLAKGLGVCVFDFVYIFVQEKSFAQKKMLVRMSELEQQGEVFYKNLMEQFYNENFKNEQSSTQIWTSFRRNNYNSFDSEI